MTPESIVWHGQHVHVTVTGEGRPLLLMAGLVGRFTTFSAFSLDTIGLLERGEAMAAIVYVVASVVVSLMTVFAGLTVVRVLV